MTIAEFLRDMIRKEGIVCLKDGMRINGYLADFFPEARRERNAIRTAISVGCLSGFARIVKEKDRTLRNMKLRQLKDQLLYEAWLSDEAADYVIATFSGALSIPPDHNCAYVRKNVPDGAEAKDKAEQILFQAGPEYVYQYGMELQKTAPHKHQNRIASLLRWAADREYAPAQRELAHLLEERNDMPEAFAWYQRAADNQDMEAAFRLSHMYSASGDVKTAAYWCEKAAKAGHGKAQLSFGIMNQYGLGVPHNQQAALQWYRRSCDQGNEEAKTRHDDLIKELHLVFR